MDAQSFPHTRRPQSQGRSLHTKSDSDRSIWMRNHSRIPLGPQSWRRSLHTKSDSDRSIWIRNHSRIPGRPQSPDEVCIPKEILTAQYGCAIIPAYQEDPNPRDAVCIPKAILTAQYGCAIIPAYQENPNPGDEVCIPKATLTSDSSIWMRNHSRIPGGPKSQGRSLHTKSDSDRSI